VNEQLRVGIVGCGEATQALHILTLNSLARRFRVEACSDLSPEVMGEVASRCGARAVADPLELIGDARVDVVLIATPDSFHADFALAACAAKKRAVLVEKPAAPNARMCREIAVAAEESGVPVLVGYPHVYEPAVQRAIEIWGPHAALAYGEFRCSLGPNPRYTADALQTIRSPVRDPWPAMIAQLDYIAAATEASGTGIGMSHVLAYGLLAGLTIHDIPVLRRVAGEPTSIDYARIRANGPPMSPLGLSIDVVFNYPRGRVWLQCEFHDVKSIDWGFHLRREGLHLTVRYPTTYAAAAPSECIARYEKDGMTVDERHAGRYETGFRREWCHVYDVVAGGAAPMTPIADAVKDLEWVESIHRAAVSHDRGEHT